MIISKYSHKLCKCFKVFRRNISWFRTKQEPDSFTSVVDGMKKIYRNKLLPLEEHHTFHEFHSLRLNDPDFEAKPLVLFIGQYSTGKTTLIRYMLDMDFPGGRTGPEPTTDRFIAVMHGEASAVIPGNALVVDPTRPFAPLAKFGNAFLTKFQCSTVPASILQGITLIDTPGILSGEKQRVDRGYDFTGVLEWFAERVDRIVLLFDAHKLDISDEFQRSIEALRGHDEKIRIVLNKADMVDHQALMRVYGALMWSLGKILHTPEVARVYVGSFWNKPLMFTTNKQLFEDEAQDLFRDLQSLPKDAALRRINDLSKRARQAKVHAYIMDAIKSQMPTLLGREAKKKELIGNLRNLFKNLEKKWDISPGDFPDITKMQQKLQDFDFNRLTNLDGTLMSRVDDMLAKDITRLMAMIPNEGVADVNKLSGEHLQGGAFEIVNDKDTPFGYKIGEGLDAGRGETGWIVSNFRREYDVIFDSLCPKGQTAMPRASAKEHLTKSKLPSASLITVYSLADVDDDGLLDKDEFALANYLVKLALEGHDLPRSLPQHLIPPSKNR